MPIVVASVDRSVRCSEHCIGCEVDQLLAWGAITQRLEASATWQRLSVVDSEFSFYLAMTFGSVTVIDCSVSVSVCTS